MDNMREIEVLKRIEEVKMPVGAIFLADELKIPQGSMGRILAKLEEEGFLEKISNKGRQITDKGREYLKNRELQEEKINTARNLIYLGGELKKSQLIEIMEIRKLLECYAIRYTCRNITEEQIRNLERLLLENILAAQNGRVNDKEDMALHLAIAKYSGKETVYQILNLLLSQKDVFSKFSRVADIRDIFQINEHKEIVEMIIKRDEEAAVQVMGSHLDVGLSNVQKYIVESEDR